MKRYWLLVLFVAVSCRGYARELKSVRPEIQSLVNSMTADTLLNTHVWNDSTPDSRFAAYHTLNRDATNRELAILTQHPNVVVRCYAFYVLAGRDTSTASIILNHLHDTATITFGDGRFRPGEMYVGDFYLELVTDTMWRRKPLKPKQMAKIDSIILFDHNSTVFSVHHALKRLPAKQEYYKRVRQMVTEERRYDAIVTLAKYKNRADTGIIIEWMRDTALVACYRPQDYALMATSLFPARAFFPVLSEIALANMKVSGKISSLAQTNLFRSIVQYKDKPSRLLLERVIRESTGWSKHYNDEAIWLALKKYPSPAYDGLLELLNMDPNRIKNGLDFYLAHYDD